SESGGHVDGVALGEGHDRLLDVAELPLDAAEALHLALADEGVDALHLDLEEGLDRFLDLRLGRRAEHVEDDLVLLGGGGRFLGDHRAADDVVMAVPDHFSRSWRASTAARVSTRVCRRSMS